MVDDADLLPAELEQELSARSADLEDRTSDQLVIVTVPSLAGRSIEDFSRDLGNHWGIGQRGRDNGVLLVVAPRERRVRIAVGRGLEPILTNARASTIINRDILPMFRDGRFEQGIDAGAAAIIAVLIAQASEPRRGTS